LTAPHGRAAHTDALAKALKKVLAIAVRAGINAEGAADAYKAHHLTLGAVINEEELVDGAPRWHERYVRLLMAERGRQVLASNSGDLATLSTEAAAVLVAKATKRRANTLSAERERLEWANEIEPSWTPDSAEYVAALGRVRQQEMDALQFKTMQVVYELNNAYSKRAVMGKAGAETREVRSLSKGMRQKLQSLLDQMACGRLLGPRRSRVMWRCHQTRLMSCCARARCPRNGTAVMHAPRQSFTSASSTTSTALTRQGWGRSY
jgi:hypothetical protein